MWIHLSKNATALLAALSYQDHLLQQINLKRRKYFNASGEFPVSSKFAATQKFERIKVGFFFLLVHITTTTTTTTTATTTTTDLQTELIIQLGGHGMVADKANAS